MLKKSVWAMCLVLTLWLPLAAYSQEDYPLGPEDEIEVRVWAHDDLTQKTRIGLDGTISFPFVGQIKAQGLTVLQLQRELERRLGPDYIIDPHVSIKVSEYKSQKFFVVGNVLKPGTYPLTKNIHIVEAISMAGGPTAGGGAKPVSGGMAIIVRAKPGEKLAGPRTPDQANPKETLTVRLNAALRGDPQHNIEIKNGDTIYVPNLIFYVSGEVKRPGRYPFEEGMTVLTAVTTAEGFTDKAAQKRVHIIREQSGTKEKIKVKLDDPIHPNDTIVVPESWF